MTAPASTMRDAGIWSALKFIERTIEVASAKGWLGEWDAAGRVPWSEVQLQFGLGPDDREEWSRHFEVQLSRRQALAVLRGKVSARTYVRTIWQPWVDSAWRFLAELGVVGELIRQYERAKHTKQEGSI